VLFVGTSVVLAFDPDLDSVAAVDAAQLVVVVALVGPALAFARKRAGTLLAGLRRLGLGRIALGALGLGVLAWLVYLLIAGALSPLLQPEQEDVTRDLGADTDSPLALLAAGILIVVLAPLSEEIFFRGFMYAGLRRAMPLLIAALISSLVWGALHLGAGNIGVAIQLTVFGVVLAWLYERTGSLWPPILAHTINNSIAFTLLVTDAI
jgi:uncharacterized protein